MSDIKLYNDDCLKVMDELIEQGIKVDAIITDPPYGMSFQSGQRKEKYKKIENDDNLDWLDDFVDKSFKLLKDNTHAYFFCSHHNVDVFKQSLQKKFNVKDILIWEKNGFGSGDLLGDYAPKYEMIFYCHKGRRLLNGNRDENVLHFDRTGNKNHPTEKPVYLLSYLVKKSTSENELVLDPFMGSGSTGVACRQTSRNFIGIELDKNYYEIANKRIYGEMQLNLFEKGE